MNRDTALILTIASVILCACPGLVFCFAGGITAMAGRLETPTEPIAVIVGIILLGFGIFLVLIPLIIGYFSLRRPKSIAEKPQNPDESLPPAI